MTCYMVRFGFNPQAHFVEAENPVRAVTLGVQAKVGATVTAEVTASLQGLYVHVEGPDKRWTFQIDQRKFAGLAVLAVESD